MKVKQLKVDELIAIISENEIDVSKALESYGKESSNIPVEESNDSVELNEVDKKLILPILARI